MHSFIHSFLLPVHLSLITRLFHKTISQAGTNQKILQTKNNNCMNIKQQQKSPTHTSLVEKNDALEWNAHLKGAII